MSLRRASRAETGKRQVEYAELYSGLDPIFHERSRLSIMTLLAANPDGASFTEIRDLCCLTDGNLSRHLHKLAEAGLVRIEKSFIRGMPNTTVQVTGPGIEKFGQYVEELARIVDEANRAVKNQQRDSESRRVTGLPEYP